ncbi:ABC transporter ATP-binding protein [Arvimicrobium flavum]|uniref:ABC transporter ATP-binding protein n=1 Tax=Arvimicrobium flavum TaxID=3393320 RepID=UPI00237AA6D8|nr:ABC transporter ATP-binding protein [Mesorhizobium shangrilense]
MAFIKLESVSVSFPVYNSSGRSIKNRIVSAATGGQISAREHGGIVVEALRDLSLEIEHGDRVALIGHNGAGKTTLLRLLAGIYEPPVGTITVEGRVAPLFDLALGLNMESTGYENIRLRGLVLGLSKKEIDARMEGIAEASELGQFLEMPLRTYSAGMLARLAFAVSIAIQSDILLLDEGIGAGDAAFMAKARQKIAKFVESAGILVLASHSDELVTTMCDKALLLEHGRIIAQGPVEEVLATYRAGMAG